VPLEFKEVLDDTVVAALSHDSPLDSRGMLSFLSIVDQCLKAGKKQAWHAASITNICVGLLAGLKTLLARRSEPLRMDILNAAQAIFQSILAEGDICPSQRRASSEGLGLLARLGNDIFTARLTKQFLSDAASSMDSNYAGSIAFALGCIHRRCTNIIYLCLCTQLPVQTVSSLPVLLRGTEAMTIEAENLPRFGIPPVLHVTGGKSSLLQITTAQPWEVNCLSSIIFAFAPRTTVMNFSALAGGMALSSLVPITVNVVSSLAKSSISSLQIWSLHGLLLTIEAAGLSYVSQVQAQLVSAVRSALDSSSGPILLEAGLQLATKDIIRASVNQDKDPKPLSSPGPPLVIKLPTQTEQSGEKNSLLLDPSEESNNSSSEEEDDWDTFQSFPASGSETIPAPESRDSDHEESSASLSLSNKENLNVEDHEPADAASAFNKADSGNQMEESDNPEDGSNSGKQSDEMVPGLAAEELPNIQSDEVGEEHTEPFANYFKKTEMVPNHENDQPLPDVQHLSSTAEHDRETSHDNEQGLPDFQPMEFSMEHAQPSTEPYDEGTDIPDNGNIIEKNEQETPVVSTNDSEGNSIQDSDSGVHERNSETPILSNTDDQEDDDKKLPGS
ncbi:UNVERIFIED_CONTAM: Protein SWEETIE, partial [Sesamum indicum]